MASGTVLTTGANSGIGLETVLELSRRGFRSVGSVRSEAKAEVVAKAAAERGLEVETVLLDVTDADTCERVLSGLELHGLVNNAGYAGTAAVEDVSDDEARGQLETMVIAPARLTRLALPAMRAHGGVRTVNVSSIYGRLPTPLTGWYQGSKHALDAVTDATRIEVASSAAKVIPVAPGATGLGDEQRARRHVPRLQPSFVERVEAAARHPAEVEGSRARPADVTDPGQHGCEDTRLAVAFGGLVGEAGSNERGRQPLAPGRCNGGPGTVSASAG